MDRMKFSFFYPCLSVHPVYPCNLVYANQVDELPPLHTERAVS